MKRALIVSCLLFALAETLFAIESAEIIGPKDAGGRYKHPTTFTELDNGDLYLAFYGGSGEYSTDTAVYGSRRNAGTKKWTAPKVIADTPFVSEGNPVVWQAPDGIVWLFYVVRYGETWSTSRIQAKISRDGAKTWSDPTVLEFEQGMMVRGRPIVLSDGNYLLPIYHETGHDTERVSADSASLFLRFDNTTKKWNRTKRIRSSNGNIQPAVVALGNDHLLAFCRRGGGYEPDEVGFIVKSESHDGGETWTEGTDTIYPNPNAAVDLLKLKSGNLVMAYNHHMAERDPLALALSKDGGKTFPYRIDVAKGGTRDFAYPYLNQTKDGRIHLTFTSKERSTINHAVFDESELLKARYIQHVKVYSEPGRFGGWPANHGIWSWGDEIVVGFTVGGYLKNPTGGHDIDRDKPSVPHQARSTDGGETWQVERPSFVDENGKQADPVALKEPIDFSNPDVALKLSGGNLYVSTDRCRSWSGPFELPTFGRPNLQARTDYLIEGPQRVTAFVAAAKTETPQEGQPLCIRTTDGGLTWNLVGWIGPEPPASYGYAIMPATVRVGETGYLSMIRRGGVFDGTKRWWVEPFLSPDDGKSWYLLDGPVIENAGNPATLTRLDSGELAMAYGMRRSPYGIRVRTSQDDGQSWSAERSIRSDGSSWDIGYPRTVQRADGKCVTIYYYHNSDSPERYIACTVWDPQHSE